MIVVTSIKRISQDCVQLTLSVGSCFFLRLSYLTRVLPEVVDEGLELSDMDLEDLTNAGFAYNAERAALSCLERSEHSRFILLTKLRRKGFALQSINTALDFLEEKGLLNDTRYAEAWLRNRSISHAEGRTKLISELCARGVDRKTAEKAVSDYFDIVGEDFVLQRAIEKCRRLGKSAEEARRYLARKGFSPLKVKNSIDRLWH